MQFDLEKVVDQIKKDEDFGKLKNSFEDTIVHSGESTYEHCLQTYEISKSLIEGELIENPKAHEAFEKFVNQEVGGIKKKDLMQITALVHDCGKMAKLNNSPLLDQAPNGPPGRKLAPGHGYWGSVIVKDILKRASFTNEAIDFISNCVRLHLAGQEYWSMGWEPMHLLRFIKASAEHFHVEVIFNIYCDLYYAKNFQDKIHLPIDLLNLPETYEPLAFSIMS